MREEGEGRGEVRGGEAPLESEETLWAKVVPAHTWRFPDLFFLADFKSPRGISICLYFFMAVKGGARWQLHTRSGAGGQTRL